MACRRNQFDQPDCHIVPHPDRPNESFCVNCPQRFVHTRSEPAGVLRFLVSAMITLGIFLVIRPSLTEMQRSPSQPVNTPVSALRK